jgi:hypothetical protein
MEENKILAGNPANTVKGARREEKEPGIPHSTGFRGEALNLSRLS